MHHSIFSRSVRIVDLFAALFFLIQSPVSVQADESCDELFRSAFENSGMVHNSENDAYYFPDTVLSGLGMKVLLKPKDPRDPYQYEISSRLNAFPTFPIPYFPLSRVRAQEDLRHSDGKSEPGFVLQSELADFHYYLLT